MRRANGSNVGVGLRDDGSGSIKSTSIINQIRINVRLVRRCSDQQQACTPLASTNTAHVHVYPAQRRLLKEAVKDQSQQAALKRLAQRR